MWRSGSDWVDAEYAFDRSRRSHQAARLRAALTRHSRDLKLLALGDAAPFGWRGQRVVGERVVPVDDIVGTADSRAKFFDRKFRPTSDRVRPRFERVYAARLTNRGVPPVELYQVGDRYFVSDGHHRVAVARAMREPSVSANVTQIVGPAEVVEPAGEPAGRSAIARLLSTARSAVRLLRRVGRRLAARARR